MARRHRPRRAKAQYVKNFDRELLLQKPELADDLANRLSLANQCDRNVAQLVSWYCRDGILKGFVVRSLLALDGEVDDVAARACPARPKSRKFLERRRKDRNADRDETRMFVARGIDDWSANKGGMALPDRERQDSGRVSRASHRKSGVNDDDASLRSA